MLAAAWITAVATGLLAVLAGFTAWYPRPAGKTERMREFPLDTSMAVSGAVLGFRDAAEAIWMRRPDGALSEQDG